MPLALPGMRSRKGRVATTRFLSEECQSVSRASMIGTAAWQVSGCTHHNPTISMMGGACSDFLRGSVFIQERF
jgi:hypothetical protein